MLLMLTREQGGDSYFFFFLIPSTAVPEWWCLVNFSDRNSQQNTMGIIFEAQRSEIQLSDIKKSMMQGG